MDVSGFYVWLSIIMELSLRLWLMLEFVVDNVMEILNVSYLIRK